MSNEEKSLTNNSPMGLEEIFENSEKDILNEVETNIYKAHMTEEEKKSGLCFLTSKMTYSKYIKAFFIFLDKMDDMGLVTITQQELAEKLSCSRATANVYVKYLREIGYLKTDGNKLGRYYVTPQGILDVGHYRLSILILENFERPDEENIFAEDYDFKYNYRLYRIMKNQGYIWTEFEEKYKDKLNNMNSENMNYLKEKEVITSKIGNFCTNCGYKLEQHWKFCNNCGEKLI